MLKVEEQKCRFYTTRYQPTSELEKTVEKSEPETIGNQNMHTWRYIASRAHLLAATQRDRLFSKDDEGTPNNAYSCVKVSGAQCLKKVCLQLRHRIGLVGRPFPHCSKQTSSVDVLKLQVERILSCMQYKASAGVLHVLMALAPAVYISVIGKAKILQFADIPPCKTQYRT